MEKRATNDEDGGGACEFGTITAPQTTPNAVFVWGLGNLSCLSNSPSAKPEDGVVS